MKKWRARCSVLTTWKRYSGGGFEGRRLENDDRRHGFVDNDRTPVDARAKLLYADLVGASAESRARHTATDARDLGVGNRGGGDGRR